jgi:hypothetical protein
VVPATPVSVSVAAQAGGALNAMAKQTAISWPARSRAPTVMKSTLETKRQQETNDRVLLGELKF